MSDLASLFPDLPREVIQEFEQPGQPQYQGPLSVQGEVAQVTDDDVARYLQSRGALRAPLPPAVSGQQQPATPEFANRGRPAPDPSGAYVEAPDYGQQQTPQQQPATQQPPPAPPLQPPQQFTQQQPLPSQTPPTQTPPPSPPIQQLPPSQTQPAPPPPPPGAPPVSQEAAAPPASPVAPSRADGIEALLGLWEGDPQLRSIVAQYLTTGQAPQVAAAAPPVTPQPPVVQPPQYLPPPQLQPQPQLQQLPTTPPPSQQSAPQFDEYTDPQLRAMWERNQQLEAAVRRIAEQQQVQEQRSFRQNADHFSSIVEATASRFRDDYQLPPNVVEDVRKVAGRLGALNTYLSGTHPLTGLPVVPDPAEAVKTALEIAYYATPSAQTLERERIQQRAAYDAQHKQRLAGVGGSSASVPRQAPAPTDQAGRHSAMVSEVGQMMNGSWPGSN